MKKIDYRILVSCALMVLNSASAKTLVGELSGEFEVNNLGAASYTIPLTVSPGTAGMEPKLTLSCSSRGDNGPLGVGFSLGGLSTITRGGASLDQDGFIDGVDFDANDRFLLDGQRLEIVKYNGTEVARGDNTHYGDAGNGASTEYRTEIDSFSRVIAHGQAGNGPAWFEVWTKSGLIYEYGHVTAADPNNSAFKPGTHSDVLSWSVNKISDTSGNYMTFTYTDSGTDTDPGPQISRIDYAGNVDASLVPYNSVEFSYTEDRPDPSLRFFMGAQMEQTNLLSKIIMKHNTVHMHEYRLEYTTNESGQSILESVQQFFGTETNADCLPKNKFGFSGTSDAGNFDYSKSADLLSSTPPLRSNTPVWTGDFNGDGLTDTFYIDSDFSSGHWIGLSNGDGTFDYKVGTAYLDVMRFISGAHLILTGDFNGDGLTDICQVSSHYGANQRWVAFSDGDGSFTVKSGSDFVPDIAKCYNPSGVLAQDFNGDGRTDLLSVSTSYANERWCALGNTNGTFSMTYDGDILSSPYDCYSDGDKISSGDFNGDGLTDVVCMSASAHAGRWVALSNGDGTFTCSSNTELESLDLDYYWVEQNEIEFSRVHPLWTGDFNGDGLTDIFTIDKGNPISNRWLGLSNGDGTFDFSTGYDFLPAECFFSGKYGKLLTGDFNGDGLTDICQVSSYSGTATDRWIALSKGDGTFTVKHGTSFLPDTLTIWQSVGSQAADFNGDGLTDLVGVYVAENDPYASGKRWLALSCGDGTFDLEIGDDVLPYPYRFNDYTENFISGDFDGNGMPDIMAMTYANSLYENDSFWIGLNTNESSRLEKVMQGYQAEEDQGGGVTELTQGVVTEIEYSPLSDTNVYVKGSGAVYPIRDIISPTYVVKTLTKNSGEWNAYSTDYSYRAARQHVNGRGFLGFQQFESYDRQTQLAYVETLAHEFPFTGRALQSETFYIPDPMADPESSGYKERIKLIENDWIFDLVSGGTLFASNPKSVETKWEFRKPEPVYPAISTVSTWSWFDEQDQTALPPTVQPETLYSKISHGNLTKNVIDYGGGRIQTTVNGYDDWVDSTHWLLGRLDESSVTHEATGQTDVVRSSAFDYDDVTGLLSVEAIEPDDAKFELITDYFYDDFGNIERKQISGPGIVTRNVEYNDYDSKGRFVEAVRNTLNHETILVNDQETGNPETSTDPNGLVTTWTYDELGRKETEELPDGTTTMFTYSWDFTTSVSVPAELGSAINVAQAAAFKLHTTTDGAPPVTTWFDKQGREIRIQTRSADNRTVNKDTGYNALGLTIAVSEPYFTGTTPVHTFTEYDALKRPVYATAPDGTVTEQVYDGLTSQVIADSNHRTTGTPAAKHQITTTVKNTKGEVLSVTDAMNNEVVYTYDPVGNLIETDAPDKNGNANITVIEYDIRGNKKRQVDPDMGEWFYTYNTLDQLTSQTDAKGNVIETQYDLLGRPEVRTNWVMKDGSLQLEGTAKWFYDGTGDGAKLGTLRREEYRDALGVFINRKSYAYDAYSRPMLELRNYDAKWFYTTLQYDTYSRVKSHGRFWRPVGKEGSAYQLSSDWTSFITENTYNAYGALLEVRDDSNHVWWECNESDYDQQGRLVRFEQGNALVTTQTFNPLTGRMEGMEILQGLGLSDYGFGYDRLGNLTQRTQTRSQNTLSETCTYDPLNRLLTSTKSGSATYDTLGNILTRSDVVGTYLYGTSRPHAVTTAGDCTYLYDANGNIIRRDRNGQYEFSANWNSFNKPVSLFAGLEGSEFEYDVNGKRTQQLIFEDSGQVIRKKIYIAETYEIEELLANPTETDRSLWQWTPVHSRIYVDTPVGRVGIRQQAASTDGTGSVTRSYLHKDHLGSVVAVSDDAANIVYYSFDAWGNRRDASDWSSILPANIDSHTPALTDRGYTGHEQLDHLQLVHMNGRIYDPVIGRMLTPDPLIQAPQNLQSFNRYSYVWNNPLSNTDPSGFVTEMLGSSDSPNGSSNGTKPIVISPENLSVKDMLKNISEKKNCTSTSTPESKTFKDGNSVKTTYSSTISGHEITHDPTTGNADELNKAGFGSPDDAAKAALDRYNPSSIDKNNEYGGWIYSRTNKDGETTYHYSNPVQSKPNEKSVNIRGSQIPTAPLGVDQKVVGDYHTHGNYDVRNVKNEFVALARPGTTGNSKYGDDFSREDYNGTREHTVYHLNQKRERAGLSEVNHNTEIKKWSSYLGTPSGSYRKFTYNMFTNMRDPKSEPLE